MLLCMSSLPERMKKIQSKMMTLERPHYTLIFQMLKDRLLCSQWRHLAEIRTHPSFYACPRLIPAIMKKIESKMKPQLFSDYIFSTKRNAMFLFAFFGVTFFYFKKCFNSVVYPYNKDLDGIFSS